MKPADAQPQRPELKTLLQDYLRQNQHAFLLHATSPAMPDSFLGIHQMRVATKRIRSVFRLMEWLSPERFNARAEMKTVRRFFKAAGNVRDIQMRELLLDRYCDKLGLDFPRYTKLLREDKLKAQKKLRKKMPHFIPSMLLEPSEFLLSLLESMDEQEVQASALQNVLFRTEEMALLFPPRYDAERFHRIRILIKENLYVLTQLNASAGGPFWKENYVEYLKKTGDVAGDWHDLEVFTEALESLRGLQPHVFPDAPHIELLMETIREEMKQDLRKYKQSIKRVIAGVQSERVSG